MKITIVSRWYNEAVFAPFFLTHYNYADKIYIFPDKDTDDNTREICKQYDNVEIKEISYKQWRVVNEIYIIGRINKFVAELKSDWVIYVDADEFIFPKMKY